MSRSWSVFLLALTLLFGGAAYGSTNEKLDRLIELLTEFRGAIDEGEFERARETLQEIEALDPELSCLVDVFPVVSRPEDSVAVEAEEIELGGVEGPLAGAYEVEVSGQPPRDSDAVARAEIRLVAAESPGAGKSRRSARRGSRDETPDRAKDEAKRDDRDEDSAPESKEANLDEGEVRIVTEDGEVVEREPMRRRVRSEIARPGRYRVEFVWRAQVVLEFWVTVVARIELEIDAAEVVAVLPSGSEDEDADGAHVVVGDAPRMPQSKLAEWFEKYAEERVNAGFPRPTLVGSKVLVPVEWKGTGSLPPVLDRSLEGHVFDRSGKALPDTVVHLHPHGDAAPIEARTDRDGRFEFDGLLPGSYEVKASEGDDTYSGPVEIGRRTQEAFQVRLREPGLTTIRISWVNSKDLDLMLVERDKGLFWPSDSDRQQKTRAQRLVGWNSKNNASMTSTDDKAAWENVESRSPVPGRYRVELSCFSDQGHNARRGTLLDRPVEIRGEVALSNGDVFAMEWTVLHRMKDDNRELFTIVTFDVSERGEVVNVSFVEKPFGMLGPVE